MGSLLVVAGPPGAGKSTVATILASRADRSVLVEGDAFHGFLATGRIPPWLPESNDQNNTVIDASAVATGAFVRGGYTTVFDGIVGPWFLARFHAASGLDELDYVVLMPDVDVCRGRVESRARASFSDLEATAKMHHEFSTATLDQRHVITDLATPEAMADLVESARDGGRLRVIR